MTLTDAIEEIDWLTHLVIEAGSEAPVRIVRDEVEALRLVLAAAKRIDPCCEQHTGDARCRGCYEL